MQTDQSTDSGTATSRRTFLTRTAVGGALVTAGALALPVGPLSLTAGARPTKQGTLKDELFAWFATDLELAAVTAYTAAFDRDLLDAEWSDIALQFQSHHQAIADTLLELRSDDAPDAIALTELRTRAVELVSGAADQNALLIALAEVEEICAATHLASIGQLAEKSTARTVAQVLAVEGQQAAYLAVGGGTPVAEVTPMTDSGDAAITIPDRYTNPPKTTTTTAAGGDGSTTTTAADGSTTTTEAN